MTTVDTDDLPTIGVLGGTGPLGRGLALRLAVAGHTVVLGSRSTDRAEAAACALREQHGVSVERLAGAPNETAAVCDVVIVAVPFDGVRTLIGSLRDELAGRVVISCVNPLAFDADGPHPVAVEEGSAAELIATLAPGAHVAGAFHHVPAAHLTRDLEPLDLDVLVTGADDAAHVHRLVEAIDGVRAVPAGPLRLSRPVEELTAALISVNKRYKTSAGVRVTGLPGQ